VQKQAIEKKLGNILLQNVYIFLKHKQFNTIQIQAIIWKNVYDVKAIPILRKRSNSISLGKPVRKLTSLLNP